MPTYYAWTEIRNGGETEVRDRADGRPFTVVTKRNTIAAGEKVTQKDVDATDEAWQAMIDGGSVRENPFPKGVDEYTSPAAAITAELVDEDGNIDINKLVSLGLAPAHTAPTEEAQEAPKPKAETPKGA